MTRSDPFDPDDFLAELDGIGLQNPNEPEEDEPFNPDSFLQELDGIQAAQTPVSPASNLGKIRYSAELTDLNPARELQSLERTLANYADRIGSAGQGAIWEEDLGKQESDTIRSVIGDAKYSGQADTNLLTRLLGARPAEDAQASNLIEQSKAVTRDGPIADSPVFAALERYKQLKQTVSPDQLKDAEAVNWQKNDRSYAELSSGSIVLRPEAFNSKDAFDGAVNAARKDGALDDREVSSLMAKWPEIEAGFNEAGMKAALPTQNFQDFKNQSDNQGLSDEAVFQKYKNSQTWVDQLKYSGGVLAKSAVDSALYPILGAATPALNKLGEETGIDSIKQAGQALSEFAVNSLTSPSYSDDTRGGFGAGVDATLQAFGQGAGQVVQALAMRKIFGSPLAGTSTVMLSGSLQTGLEGYLGVYESAIASGKTHEQANAEATSSFVANMPSGLLEAVPIDRVLSKIPRGLVGKAAKAIGSGLAEVATENIQNYANNLVNQAVSSTYMQQQGMGLEENVGMFAGMTALDVITGSVRGRISRSSFSRTMRPDSTVLAPEERSERNKLVDYIATDLSQSIDEYRSAYGDKVSQANIRKIFANAPGMANPNVADPAIDAFERILKADNKSKAEKDLRTAAEKAAAADSPLVAETLNKAADKTKSEVDSLLTAADILEDLEGDEDGDMDTGSQGDSAGAGVISEEQATKPADDPAAGTSAPASTLRESVLASGVPEESVDAYIADLKSKGLSEEQIKSVIDSAKNLVNDLNVEGVVDLRGGVINQPTAPAPAAETPAPAPTLRESVVATGMADDAADAYIEDLRSQGIADEQILEIADNTRALREEAVKKNEADAEARREVARRARAGDPEARAQLERERGINAAPVAESSTPLSDPAPAPAAETQFVNLGGPPPQFQGGTNQLAGPQETPALLAPEPPSTQQPTTPEGGDTTNEEEMQRRTETLNTAPQPQPPIPGAEGQGDGATPPPAETPAPAPVSQGVRAAGAKGVISGKPLPVVEQETGRDEEGRPITKVTAAFVNDADTLAESLHQNGGAERIYIPDEILDSEDPKDAIDNDRIGYNFEKETGRAYVTWARHSRYQDSPVMENGRTEDNETLEQLYQRDPKRQANSEAQTQGEGVSLAELDKEFEQQLDAAELSDLEKNDPEAVARELTKIDSMAANLASETVTTNDGSVASIGPALADMIAQAAKNRYIGRLRGVVSGDFADAAGAVRDVKAKAVRALKSRGGENVGVSLDQQIGDGTTTVGDVTGASQALQDEQQSEQEVEPTADTNTQPQAVDEAMQYATDMAVMELPDADRKIWLEYKNRMTSKRTGGRGQYITKDQKRVADQVAAKARENLVEMLALEQDVGDDSGSLKPPVLTEQEQQQQDALDARLAQALENKIRRNTERMLDLAKVASGEKASVRTVLEALSKDKNETALVRFFANWLLKSGHNFSEVKVHLIANRDKRTKWAGRYKPGGRASSGTIQINTAANHKGSIGQTFLHEALHHIVLYKLRPSYKRNAVEQAAYRDLMKVLTYARRQVIMPEPGETLGQVANRELGGDETFYGLTNIDELFTETLTNGRFFEWMNGQQAIPGLQTKGFFRNLWQQVRSIFQNFFSGINVRQNSLLSQALDNIMALGQDAQSNAKITEYNRTATERSRRRQVNSVRGSQRDMLGKEISEVMGNAVAEQPEVAMLGEADFDTAKELLLTQIRNPKIEVNARGGVRVSLNSPDPSTAKYLGIQDPLEARAIHLLTDEIDRKTVKADKVRTANLVGQTLRQADFVGYYDWASPNGKVPMLVYAKLYTDSESPTGTRWHFVEVRDLGDRALLETQYSSTEPDRGRALNSNVQWVGDAPRKKMRDGGAGHEQGLPKAGPQKYQDMLPDVSPTARENIDSTTDESVQLEILEAVTALTEKRARLLAQQSYTEAGQVDEQIRQLEEKFSQSPTPPSAASIPSQPTRAQIRRMKQTSAGWKASGLFGQGLMDTRVFKRENLRDSEIRAANYRVTETARRFNRQVKESGASAQVLRDAIGTTENRLTDSQYDQFKKMQRAAKRETDPAKRQAAQQAADQFRITQVQANNQTIRAKRQSALAQFPAELRGTVMEMRKHMDGFTKTIISKGMVGSDLQTTLGDNLEVYLTRSYEIFDNPEWADFIQSDQSPESIVVRNDAQRLFRSQLVAEEARRIRRNAKMANQPVPTRQAALAAAQATVTQNDVDTMMQDYLRKGDGVAVAILGGRLPGKKDMSIMKLRGQIPKEIRALWGEYKDPEVNYARTYMSMARFVAEHSFQQDFLDMGLNSPTPFLWKEGVSTSPKPAHWVLVYPGLSDSPNPNPMAGVYGPEIVGQAFKDMDVQIKHPMVNEWLMGLTGFSMAAKTVYNVPQSNVRNFLGNGLLMFAQGYLGADITKLGFLSRMATSANVTGPQAFGLRPERNAAVTDYVERLIGLGVMGDNVKANVVKALTSVVFDRNPSKAFGEKAAMAWKFAKGANERVTDAYQAADDFWKIVAFESERSLMGKAYPNATPESLDRMAADRVRDVVPTYSMIPKIVQDLVKKQPYFAPFISWTSEIIRTTANTYRIGWQDATSGNPALQVSGLYRLGLATTAQVALGAVAYMVREMIGVSDEDEERLRRFLPEWQVNALLMVTGKKENGKISFWDLSYLNPYNVLQEPFIAVSRELASGAGALSAAAAGAQKLLDPWTGEQLLFGAIMDVARGVTVDGNPLYEKADSEWNKNKARLNRLASALTPGSVNIGTRIYKAFTGTIERSGRSYDLSNELIGPIIGQRLTENDPMQSFQIGKIPKFKGMMQSASNLATREFRTRGTPDLTKIRENYVQSNDARMKAFSEIKKDVDALIGLGVPEPKVWGALAAAELSKDDLRQIQEGVYVRRAPSNDALDNAVGTPEYLKKIQAMREAIAGYPETQTLTDPE